MFKNSVILPYISAETPLWAVCIIYIATLCLQKNGAEKPLFYINIVYICSYGSDLKTGNTYFLPSHPKKLAMRKILLLCFALSALVAQAEERRVYSVEDYGVVSDGVTLNTTRLQGLIDRVSQEGGGVLLFEAGDYLTGNLVLKSDIELHLEKGATILGSTNPYDYTPLMTKEAEGDSHRKDNSKLALMLSHKCENISITGSGTIDGQGLELALNIDSLHHIGEVVDPNYNMTRMRTNETMRPKLFFISECSSITIEGVSLRNSACWGLTFDLCEGITLSGVDIFNRAYWNNDGVDITDSRNVRITGCNVNSADDGICLKSYHTGSYNDQIYISDCTIRTSASAIKFGTASWGGFKNITIERIKVRDTYRSAIAIESVDGGDIENVVVRDIEAYNTGNALFVRLGHRDGDSVGTIKNIHISRLYAEVSFSRPDIDYDLRGPALNYFHNIHPAPIAGIRGHNIENITLEDIEIVYPGRASKSMAYVPLSRLEQVDDKAKEYPEFSMFGELPSWGFYIRNVDGISMSNITLRLKNSDYRPAFIFDGVSNIQMGEINLPATGTKKDIILKGVTDYTITGDNIMVIE